MAARRWRRTPAPTASTRRRSPACSRWRTSWSASPATCSTRPTARSARSPRAAPSPCLLAVQAARDGRPDVAGPNDGAPDHRARGVPQGRALLRRRAPRRPGRRRPPRRPRRDGGGDRRRTRCWWWPRRRRTPTAWSTRSPRSRPLPPSAGCAATSTPASAAGCCRTPPGSAATSRRGRSRSTASRRSRSTPTSTPTPPRAPRCCCTAPGAASAAVLRLRRLAGLHDAQHTLQSTKSGGPLAGAWAVVQALGDAGYLELARQAFAATDAIVAGVDRRAAGARRPRLHAGHRGHRRHLRPVHRGRRDEDPRVVRPAAAVVRRLPPTSTSRSVPRPSCISTSCWRRCDAVGRRGHGRPGRGRPRRRRLHRGAGPRRASRTRTSTACSRPPGWSAGPPPAGWRCRAGWPRSTRCSTSPPRRCARRS